MDDELEKKLQSIIAEWEQEDTADAADELESGKDAMDLAQPSTWAAHDLANKPMQGPEAPPKESPLPPAADPATAGAGQKAPLELTRREPAASPPPPVESLDWKGLESRLRNAELRNMQTRAGESMRANIIPGYKPDLEGGEAQSRIAMQPLQVAKEKQGYESRQAASGVKDAMDNPNSLQSQKAREAVRTFFEGTKLPAAFDNWSANEVQRWTQTFSADRKAERDLAEEAKKDRRTALLDERHATERGQDLEHRKLTHEDSMANTAATRALVAAGQSKLPAGEAAKLGGADSAVRAIDELSSDWDAKAGSTGAGLKQFVPGTDANLFLPGLRTTTQIVGTFLEGGKLTDADVPKYAAMMPQPSDTKAQKDAKIAALKRLIEGKRSGEAGALKGAGYRVPESDAPKTVRVRRRDTGDTDEFDPEIAEQILKNPNFERAP